MVCSTAAVGSPTSGIAIGPTPELSGRIGYVYARIQACVPWQSPIGSDLDGDPLGAPGLG